MMQVDNINSDDEYKEKSESYNYNQFGIIDGDK